MPKLLHSKNFLSFLIILDIFMAIAATVYDWNKYMELPWYLLLFAPICPVYPLFIAICFWYVLQKKEIPSPLLAFTLMGAISYGIMNFIFYPLHMIYAGFTFQIVGNMLWVFVYTVQALLLVKKPLHPSMLAIGLIGLYFLCKDIIDMFFYRFSYVIGDGYPMWIKVVSFVCVLVIHAGLVVWIWRGRKKSS